jgi:hypothetical protein
MAATLALRQWVLPIPHASGAQSFGQVSAIRALPPPEIRRDVPDTAPQNPYDAAPPL